MREQRSWSEKILDVMNANKSASVDGTAKKFADELAAYGMGLEWNTKWQEWTIRPIEESKPYSLTAEELNYVLDLLLSEASFCERYAKDLMAGNGVTRQKVRETLKIQAQLFNRWADYLK